MTVAVLPDSAPPRTAAPRDEIDVVFGVDANFAPHAAAVISSVARQGGRYRFIVLHAGVDAATRELVETVAPGMRFVWVEVGDDDVPPFADRHHFTRATLFRFGMEKLAPADCERVVYLDADITVLRDIRPLWTIDLKGQPVGAVHDPNVDAAAFAAQWGLEGPPRYFNAGILVVDLKRVRAERLFSKAIDFLAKHGPALPWNDQDALNWACWGKWAELEPVWNVQRSMAIDTAARTLPAHMRIDGRKPAIIHFTGGEKPWIAGAYHPWSWLYWQSVTHTPFEQAISAKYGVSRSERAKMLLRFVRRWNFFGA